MRNRTRLGLAAVFGAAALLAACGDDENSPGGNTAGTGGTSGGSGGTSAGTTSGGTSAGTSTGGSSGGTTAGTAGSGGTTAGTGGTTAGTGGTTAGTGGTVTVEPIVPTVFIIDNVRLQLKGEGSGGESSGGAGGADSGGAGGESSGGAGSPADAPGGAGGAATGAAGEGGAGPGPDLSFLMTFDADLGAFAKNANGFSPSVGGDTAGPAIFDGTTLTFDAAAGKPGGAAKISVPFSVPKQQADFFVAFAGPQDLTGYEILADVKVTAFGDAGDCSTAWIYVWGSGYANDKAAEPAQGETNHLVKDAWTTIRLDLDGPYGYHSTANHPNFKPTQVLQWGVQLNTFGCP